MIRKAIPNTLIIAIFLLAPIGANAAFWIITDTVQNGTNYAPGFGSPGGATLGFVGWFTNGTGGGGNQNIVGSTGTAPGTGTDYACYGLEPGGPTSCAAASSTVFWDTTRVVFSGSINDD